MKVVDSFIFFNELDLLEFRLRELWDVVDYFILVESMHSFSGGEKNLYFNEVKNKRFSKYLSKIVHVVVDDMPNGLNAWDNERHQRQCIVRGLNLLDLDESDVLIISDVDEVPDAETVSSIRGKPLKNCIHCLEQDFYYYNLQCLNEKKWLAAKVLNMRTFRSGVLAEDADAIRSAKKLPFWKRLVHLRKRLPVIKRGGWHFSYFGNVEFIKTKIINFSHQEFNKEEFLDDSAIIEKIINGDDLFSRENERWLKVHVSDASYLPVNYRLLLDMFDVS